MTSGGGSSSSLPLPDAVADLSASLSSSNPRSPLASLDHGDPLYPRPAPPSPLATRRPIPMEGREVEQEAVVTSPPLLKRRSFSHVVNEVPPLSLRENPSAAEGAGAVVTANRATSLRTINSRCEMDNDDLYTQPRRLFDNNIRNRDRAASSDIVLTIGDERLPQHRERQQRPQQQWGVITSFLTPERPIMARLAHSANRDRANTCPNRPQRHSIFGRQQVDVDVESGALDGQRTELDEEEHHNAERTLVFRSYPLASGSVVNSNAAMMTSPERRRQAPSSASRPSSAPADPSFAAATANESSPPPVSQRSPLSSSLSMSAVIATTGGLQANGGRSGCIFRINLHFMKALMVFSLYALLAYTWNTDLRQRYQSAEINYGLSEYWHGGLSPQIGKAERIGRQPVPGKLFNDDGGDDGVIAKLIEGSSGDDKLAESAFSGDSNDIRDVVLQKSLVEKMKRRPLLSHARSSVLDASHPAFRVYGGRRQTTAVQGRGSDWSAPKEKWWTLSRLARALAWVAFALPVVEAGLREARRRLGFGLRNGRLRPRSFRAVQGGGGRVSNVHDL